MMEHRTCVYGMAAICSVETKSEAFGFIESAQTMKQRDLEISVCYQVR